MKNLIKRLMEDFILENGQILHQPEVAYSTYGKLNEDKSNVVLICHALTANSQADEWWSGLFGEGNIFDPAKHYIICLNQKEKN